MRTEAEFALALRQQRLLLRSEAVRASIATEARVLGAPLALADQGRALAQWLYARRLWVGAGLLCVLIVRPRRAWRIASTAWWLWRSALRVRRWLVAAGLMPARRTGQDSFKRQET